VQHNLDRRLAAVVEGDDLDFFDEISREIDEPLIVFRPVRA
jgi:hypothetical protein